MSEVESHEPDLDEVEKVGSQFLGCAKVGLHLLYLPLMHFLVVGERRGWRDELREEIQWRREEREGGRECMCMSLPCFLVAAKRRGEEGRDVEGEERKRGK